MQYLLQSSINRTKIHQYNIETKYIFKRKKMQIKLSENSLLSQNAFFFFAKF